MLEDEFRDVLSALSGHPSPQVQKRADSESATTLTSGRSPPDLSDLLAELAQTLHEVWENDELVRVPAPGRRNLLQYATQLVQAANQYGAGQSDAQSLENAVDRLHTGLWQNNLIDRIERLPGYEAKNKALESLKRKGRRIVRELDKGLQTKTTLDELSSALEKTVGEATARRAEIDRLRDEARQQKSDIDKHVSDVTHQAHQSTTLLGQVQEERDRATSLANEVDTLKTRVERFHAEIATNESKLNTAIDTAEETVAASEQTTKDLIKRLTGLEEQIDDQLQKATGVSLFGAFNERRKTLRWAAWIWAALSVFFLGFTVWWGGRLADTLANAPQAGPDAVFFLRLGAILPLLTVVVLCMSQYGRERRTEEEYAFKSALSLSLVPYKELIEALEKSELDAEYAKFLVRTIGQIYEAPRLTKEKIEAPSDLISIKAIDALTKGFERLRR